MEQTFQRPYRGPVKAVIFDWAGTTVDYGCFAPVMPFIETFSWYGVPISVEEARAPMGLYKKDHLRAIAQTESVKQRWLAKHKRQLAETDIEAMFLDFVPLQLKVLANHAKPIPGVVEAVDRLRKQGLKIGSTTGYTREMMDILTPIARQQGYAPDSVVSVSEVPAGRPEPWMALLSAMLMRIYPMEAVVKVGDTLHDIAEGLNAGMWTVGVTLTGNEIGLDEDSLKALPQTELRRRRETACLRLSAAGAHYVIDGVWEVPEIIQKINLRLGSGERP
jgi:phosphonoacetaldehyde hydrolase